MREEKAPAVYILASRKYGVLYIGVTSALWNRVAVHKEADIIGFTKHFNIKLLVWYEHHAIMEAAIKREKQLKKWNRVWKIRLIEEFNPNWNDLHQYIDYEGSMVTENTDSRLRGNDGF
jgi:putative endonuclease